MTVTAGVWIAFAFQTLTLHVLFVQMPPFFPHCSFAVQFVAHVPEVLPVATTHEPAAAPGHVASVRHVAFAGPVKSASGPFGDSQIESTYAKLPWTVSPCIWFGKQDTGSPAMSWIPMSAIGGSAIVVTVRGVPRPIL